MRLAVSQIAWETTQQGEALALLRGLGYTGLEIAPPMVAGPQPYEKPEAAAEFAAQLRREHGLSVCSMQSIWYGQQGSLFGRERAHLLEYTKQAVRFAEAAGARNLVFGCPRNRILPEGRPETAADDFFCEAGDYAHQHGAVLALEANPPLYGTNFMNTTQQALETAARIDSPGVMVNLDFGTMVENGEDVAALAGQVRHFSHVHISEPGLAPLQRREGHAQLAALLRDEGYAGWVSIEMKAAGLDALRDAAEYVADVFADMA